MVATGLEQLLSDAEALAQSGRLGLLYHQASTDRRLRSAPDLISAAFPGRLRVLFGPQHGVWGTEQDNMIETEHRIHSSLGIPLYSLYSATRRPTPEMLEVVDTVLVDLQDVGTRVYTYATTILHMMEACAEAGRDVVILDRPNPVNCVDVEGNMLKAEFASFVGPFPLPMRHGLTPGELMTLYNEVHQIGCRLRVVPMKRYTRTAYFDETGLPWVPPSPNMPLVETAIVYPGQVALEGTNVSEGRGTVRPFEIFGAPYIDPKGLIEAVEPGTLDGAILRETEFRPTFNKWAGRRCAGFQIHVVDRRVFRPVRAALALLRAIIRLYGDDFAWTDPPYEYEYEKPPIDVIFGDDSIRKGLESGASVFDMERAWEADLAEFLNLRSRFLIYS